MTYYITQGCYSQKALAGMLKKPEDRAAAVEKLASAAGAKLVGYYVTFGEYDFLVIMESGKGRTELDTMAALITAGATGGVTNLRTTVAVSSKDSVKAMKAAAKMVKGFQPAGGADS
jgi:uncharacterized protein with GYD domain